MDLDEPLYLDGKCYTKLVGYSNTESCAGAGGPGSLDAGNGHEHEHEHEDDNDDQTVRMLTLCSILLTNQTRRPQQYLPTSQSGILTL